MTLQDDIKNNQIVLIVVTKTNYQSHIDEIIKAVDASSEKICYAALTKPYNSIIATLKKLNLDSGKYFFIDVLTSTIKTPAPDPNCEFIQAPSALTEISLAYTKAVQEKGCKNTLFDSISTLTVYQEEGEVIKLVHTLINKARVNNLKSVYIALQEDNQELIKDIFMFVDSVIEIKS
ncbi:hypothetical protein JW826_05205 [Candidatus Woesearchaeota archaeon]|nr:hypothetical protein [Candidatus Woesearchaeota archaeon]